MPKLFLPAFYLWIIVAAIPAHAQTRSEIDTAKAALDLKIYQATAAALVAAREAEARKATAEAERAELLARLPPSSSKTLAGEADVTRLGAAGLLTAFDLARELAAEVCTALPLHTPTVVHDPVSTQGVVSARIVADGIAHMRDQLARQALELQALIDSHSPEEAQQQRIASAALAAVPAVVKAAADIGALFKSDVTAQGLAYGDGARSMFATALAQACPGRVVALGAGYLGELDHGRYAQLMDLVRQLMRLAGENAGRVSRIERLADAAKGETKAALSDAARRADGLLKAAGLFVESLKVGETGDKSPLYNASRYIGYANRVSAANVLDFDLRLEGISLVKDGLFTGQRLRLSGMAFLWYRLHQPDGTLLMARTVRRAARPVQVDLRGELVEGGFWRGE